MCIRDRFCRGHEEISGTESEGGSRSERGIQKLGTETGGTAGYLLIVFFDCFVRYIIKVVVVSILETTTTFIYRDLTKKDSILQSRNIPLNPPCILYLFHPF